MDGVAVFRLCTAGLQANDPYCAGAGQKVHGFSVTDQIKALILTGGYQRFFLQQAEIPRFLAGQHDRLFFFQR